jgi:hypothetical protein
MKKAATKMKARQLLKCFLNKIPNIHQISVLLGKICSIEQKALLYFVKSFSVFFLLD